MNRSTQWMQEARPLAWPWMLTLAAGIFAIAFPASHTWREASELILPAGAFFAIPLLATLPIGNEFQHRTLALRLSQPLPRQIFWRQKLLTAVAAVAPLAVLYGIALNLRFGRAFLLVSIIWMVLTTTGAIPFTFLARSTIGGLVLSAWVYAAVACGWMYFENHGALSRPWLWLIAAAVVAYAIAMLWLGRRMVLRYQSVEGVQGESFAPGAQLVPSFVAEWLRCRPTQPVLNLVRREFRLLRTLWPLCALCITAWVFVVTFKILPAQDDQSGSSTAAVAFTLGMTVIFTMLLAHLAGTLSLGEEKSMGTHAWQLTMPISPTLQWLVKLGVALFSSLVFSVAIPMALLLFGGAMRGNESLYLSGFVLWRWPLGMAAITFISFWCACISKGAVRATIWFLAILLAGAVVLQQSWIIWYLTWLGDWPTVLASHFDPINLERFFRRFVDPFLHPFYRENASLALIIALTFLLAVAQSRRLFRSQAEDTFRNFARCTAPLLGFIFCAMALVSMTAAFSLAAWRQKNPLIREVHAAIEARVSTPEAAASQKLTADDLNRAAALSDRTRRWLGNATITAQIEPYVPNLASAAAKGYWRVEFGEEGEQPVPYSAIIRTGDGKHSCTLNFTVVDHRPVGLIQIFCDGE